MKKISCILLLVLASCNKNVDSDIFNGNIEKIEDNVVQKEIKFNEFEFNNPNYGKLAIYDTLAIYMTPQSPSHWYQVFNLNTGEELGKFAMKGNGHEEFGPVGNIDNFHVEDNELKTLVFEANKERVHLWNITKSLAEGTTVIEREVKMPWRKETKGACFNEIFMKDSNTAYAKVQSLPVNEYEATLPYYQIMDLKNGEQTSGINIFKRPVVNKKTDCLPEILLDSHDVMKPDGTKIAQAMLNVPQLNIIDTGSKTVEGHLLDCDMALSDLETRKAFNLYFIRICADDDYIYTVYYGEEPWGANDIPCLNRLFVFDWDGNLVSKIVTKHCMDRIAVDNRNRILYTTSFLNEKLYYIKTDELTGVPCHPQQ